MRTYRSERLIIVFTRNKLTIENILGYGKNMYIINSKLLYTILINSSSFLC